MSKLDELLNGTLVHAFDARDSRRDAIRKLILDASDEVADLRQRAEDAELLARATFDAKLNGKHALDWYFQSDGTVNFPGRFVLGFDFERGLPVLTDEARAMLRKELGS